MIGSVFMLAVRSLRRHLMRSFLTILGIALAELASRGLAGAMGVPFVFDPAINALALVFSGLIGVVFGYSPAYVLLAWT
jgi:ABC-type antimicrobial peptide transport system permease subunit